MLAGNLAINIIFKKTGIVYDSRGNMYYFAKNNKMIAFYENGDWIFSNLKIVSGYIQIKYRNGGTIKYRKIINTSN